MPKTFGLVFWQPSIVLWVCVQKGEEDTFSKNFPEGYQAKFKVIAKLSWLHSCRLPRGNLKNNKNSITDLA